MASQQFVDSLFQVKIIWFFRLDKEVTQVKIPMIKSGPVKILS